MIKDINCLIVDIPTIRPHKMSVATMGAQSMVIIRLLTSDGIEGIGEATTIGGLNYGGESPESIKTNIDSYFKPLLVGKPANQITALRKLVNKTIKDNRFAKSAIETALYDARAKSLGISLSDLFGGRIHDSISVAWTLASGDTKFDIAEAEELLDAKRHNIFKLKIGLRDPKDDIRHISSIKKALGDDVSIRVDINQGWSETQAVRYLQALA
ncbi:MAG TPA: enolase C-terminal domain-like protein, partial [Eoetvoesiella sp.]